MHKTIVYCLLLGFTAALNGQQLKFKVGFSENYAVFEFVRNLSYGDAQDPFYKRYQNSAYKTDTLDRLLAEFSTLNYFYNYEYPQYPYGSKIGGNTFFILGSHLLQSRTLEEARQKSFGIIPYADLAKFYQVLAAFRSIYLELVYLSYQATFTEQVRALEKLLNTVDCAALFRQVQHFHGAVWEDAIPFYFHLYPIPDERSKGFTATAFYNHAVGGIPLGLTDYQLLLSVMFHEIFHILYDEQPLRVKEQIASWFAQHLSPNSTYASLLFNEALTTALANGYFYRAATGSLSTNSWYNNPFIADMAVQLFPLVERYLDQGQSIDENFIRAYVEIFDTKFSQWLFQKAHIFMQRYIITENQRAFDIINQVYPFGNIQEYDQELSLLSLEKMKSHPITKIIVVSTDHQAKLALVRDTFAELQDWTYDPDQAFAFSKFLADKTFLIIINDPMGDIDSLIKALELK